MMMTKEELVNEISYQTGFTKKDSLLFIDVFCDVICEALENGDCVKIVDFGIFEVKERKARTGKNFAKNTTHPIPPKKVPNFVPGKGLKQVVGGVNHDGH